MKRHESKIKVFSFIFLFGKPWRLERQEAVDERWALKKTRKRRKIEREKKGGREKI
jgi:hypothetical protein